MSASGTCHRIKRLRAADATMAPSVVPKVEAVAHTKRPAASGSMLHLQNTVEDIRAVVRPLLSPAPPLGAALCHPANVLSSQGSRWLPSMYAHFQTLNCMTSPCSGCLPSSTHCKRGTACLASLSSTTGFSVAFLRVRSVRIPESSYLETHLERSTDS